MRRYQSASAPALLDCDDGAQYVVKALRNDSDQGRMLFNDQVVARVGLKLGAPVPDVAFVNVPQELIVLNPGASALGHIEPGLAHGSRWLSNVSDDRVNEIKYATENKQRLALLSVLYGLMHCSDRQFLYDNEHPFHVHSHDHGHFFPGGPNWTASGLSTAVAPSLDNELVTAAALSADDMAKACGRLSSLTDEFVAQVVALPPDEWGVTLADRVSLARFVAQRRDALLQTHVHPSQQG